MDIKRVFGKTMEFLRKYKYAVLVFMIGLVLMAIPSSKEAEPNVTEANEALTVRDSNICDELSEILQRIEGAGAVRVMLTVKTGEQTIYYEDEEISTAEDTSDIQRTVVTVTDENKNQAGLIRYTIPPTYLGAIVVCQGADSASVKLAIIDAVSKITGLSTDRISVLKMKS